MAAAPRPTAARIAGRTVLGIGGSYALASAAALAMQRLYPAGDRAGVSLGELFGFALFGAAAILAFSIRSDAKAWGIVGGGAVAFALVAILLGTARP